MNAQLYFRDFTGDIYFRDIKLEEGYASSSWTPAPEDLVHGDSIISSINMSNESITISSDKINLNGATTISTSGGYTQFVDGAIKSYDADETTYASLNDGILNLHHNNYDTNYTYSGIFNTSPNGKEIEFFMEDGELHIYADTTINFNLGTDGEFNTNAEMYTNAVETGRVGIGGRTEDATNNSNVAGYYCQFKTRRRVAPTSITLTAESSSGTNKFVQNFSYDGFWFYITNTSGTANAYRYWRGAYTTVD